MKNISTKKSSNTKWIWVIALSIVVAGMIYYNQVNVQNAPPSEGSVSVSDSAVVSESENLCAVKMPDVDCKFEGKGTVPGGNEDWVALTKAYNLAHSTCITQRSNCVISQSEEEKANKKICENTVRTPLVDCKFGSANSEIDCDKSNIKCRRIQESGFMSSSYGEIKYEDNNALIVSSTGGVTFKGKRILGQTRLEAPYDFDEGPLKHGHNYLCTMVGGVIDKKSYTCDAR